MSGTETGGSRTGVGLLQWEPVPSCQVYKQANCSTFSWAVGTRELQIVEKGRVSLYWIYVNSSPNFTTHQLP